MTEKSNALALAQLLMLHADTIENDSIKNMVIDSATELAVLHDEIERLTAERDEAVRAEREACAKVCDEVECGSYMMIEERQTANECAGKIRARGEVP